MTNLPAEHFNSAGQWTFTHCRLRQCKRFMGIGLIEPVQRGGDSSSKKHIGYIISSLVSRVVWIWVWGASMISFFLFVIVFICNFVFLFFRLKMLTVNLFERFYTSLLEHMWTCDSWRITQYVAHISLVTYLLTYEPTFRAPGWMLCDWRDI